MRPTLLDRRVRRGILPLALLAVVAAACGSAGDDGATGGYTSDARSSADIVDRL